MLEFLTVLTRDSNVTKYLHISSELFVKSSTLYQTKYSTLTKLFKVKAVMPYLKKKKKLQCHANNYMCLHKNHIYSSRRSLKQEITSKHTDQKEHFPKFGPAKHLNTSSLRTFTWIFPCQHENKVAGSLSSFCATFIINFS